MDNNEFIALDVETANPNLSSICQIGLVHFKDGIMINSWEWVIDPEAHFDLMNIRVHRIKSEDVIGKPKFSEIHDQLLEILSKHLIVTHTSFDQSAIQQVCIKYGLPMLENQWLDSARIVRRTWEQFSQKGYGLSNVAYTLGIQFNHHNAKEDARAAGEILIKAMALKSLSVSDLIKLSRHRIGYVFDKSTEKLANSILRDGNEDGILFGEVITFTGAISIDRRLAADLASKAGCTVTDGVTKKTTLIVVGELNHIFTNGQLKSSKHLKAEKLILEGQDIRILSETDFLNMIS
jgi:DNA polymerase-3 subunit epsilon